MVRRLFQLFSRKAMFYDDEIELVLSDEDVSDSECGIEDGFTFCIYPRGSRKYAGYVSLRLGESGALYYLGHIGYRIEPEFRGRGYAGKACRLITPLIERLGLESVVITTNVDNIPSRKTCEKLGCTLERIAPVPTAYQAICAGATKKCRYIWRISPCACRK